MLAEADWVVASVHYGQNQSREQITRRVVDALANPHVSAFAHPTGRLLTQRKPYEIDLEAVLRAARDHGKMHGAQRPSAPGWTWTTWPVPRPRITAFRSSFPPTPTLDGLAAMRYGVLQARRGGPDRRRRGQHAGPGPN